MKSYFSQLLCGLFVAFCVNCLADCSCDHKMPFISCPKTYIQSDQIAFFDSKIYVKLDQDIFIVPAIYSDQTGFYIENTKQPHGRCNAFEYYYCPSCGTEMQ